MANSSPLMNAVSVAIRSSGCAFTSVMQVSRKCCRSESFRARSTSAWLRCSRTSCNVCRPMRNRSSICVTRVRPFSHSCSNSRCRVSRRTFSARKLSNLLHQPRRLLANGGFLLTQCALSPLQLPALLHQSRSDRLRRSQPSIQPRQLRTPGSQFILLRLNGPAKLHQLRRQPPTLCLRLRPRSRRCRKLMLRSIRTQPRILHVLAYPRKLILAKRQLHPQPRQFRLRLFVPMLRRINLALRNLLPCAHFLQRLLRYTQIGN